MWGEFPFQHPSLHGNESRGDKIGFKTSIGFVDSIWEMLGGLLAGITTIVLPTECSHNPNILLSTIVDTNITWLTAVPSLWETVCMALDTRSTNSRMSLPLRVAISSGEPFLLSTCEKLIRFLSEDCTLLNLYGSTELTGDCMWLSANWIRNHLSEEHQPNLDTNASSRYFPLLIDGLPWLPLGVPLPNITLHLVDPDIVEKHDFRLNISNWLPNEVGQMGVLFVAGALVARGFWSENRNKDIFCSVEVDGDVTRAVNTRDVCRWIRLSEHRNLGLQYIGRIDSCVKIRGVRVEIGEVLGTILSSGLVHQVEVLPSEEATPHLLAFTVLKFSRTFHFLPTPLFLMDLIVTMLFHSTIFIYCLVYY